MSAPETWDVLNFTFSEHWSDYNSTHLSSSTIYGLQNALSPSTGFQVPFYSEYHKLYIFWEHCSGSTSSCFSHCNNSKEIFSSLPNLHNCVIGMLLKHFATSDSRPSSYSNETGQTISVPILPSSTATQLGDQVKTCFDKACELSTLCLLNSTSDEFYKEYGSIWQLQHKNSIGSLCHATKTQLTQDIGGVGIYISYWIQASLVLLALIGIFTCKLLLPNLHIVDVERSYASLIAHKRLSRLVLALTDFHKAQCYFVVATNIAAIVITTTEGFKPDTLQQIYNNYLFLRLVAVSGFLPVSFTLLLLHIVQMTSWYLILLTFIAVTTALGTLILVGIFNVTAEDSNFLATKALSGGPEECGGFQPWLWCFETVGSAGEKGVAGLEKPAYNTFAFCLLVIFMVVLRKFGLTHPGKRLRDSMGHAQNHARNFVQKKLRPATDTIYRIYISVRHSLPEQIASLLEARYGSLDGDSQLDKAVVQRLTTLSSSETFWIIFETVIYLVLIIVYLVFFNTFLRELAWFHKHNIYDTSWSFGQLVAIFVWAPALGEYAHLELRGMKRGMEHKLLPPYRIVGREREDTSDERGSSAQSGDVRADYVGTDNRHTQEVGTEEFTTRIPERDSGRRDIENPETPVTWQDDLPWVFPELRDL